MFDLGLEKPLELDNLERVQTSNSLIGIWTVLNVADKYPFSSNERELMKAINTTLSFTNSDPYALYKYGLYANSVAAEIKGLDIKEVTEAYNNLIIQSRKDLAVTNEDIMKILNKEPGSYLREINNDIEKEVLYGRLVNEKNEILKYVIDKYG